MIKLNPESAKKLALKYLGGLKDKEEQEFNIIHTNAVVEIASLLGKRANVNVDDLIIASWVHDIGKSVDVSGHAKYSIDLLIKEGYILSPVIEDCVLNHGTGSVATTREGKIIQAADKLSILSIPILELLFKQKKILETDIEFITKMTNGSVDHLKRIDFI
ncbi:MAG: HD domain-containing protein [Candidatus Taylorbacteria bacterium]